MRVTDLYGWYMHVVNHEEKVCKPAMNMTTGDSDGVDDDPHQDFLTNNHHMWMMTGLT